VVFAVNQLRLFGASPLKLAVHDINEMEFLVHACMLLFIIEL
jgi:hypothetical protein